MELDIVHIRVSIDVIERDFCFGIAGRVALNYITDSGSH